MTDYTNLEFLLDEPTKLRLQSAREVNPNYRYYSDEDLYYELRKSGVLEERFHNKSVDDAYGFSRKEKARADDRTFQEKYDELGLFGRSIEFVGDLVPDWDWAQRAYNKSLTGVTRHALMGEEKFKFDPDDDVGVVEDIVSSAASFLMPLDMITLGAGSKMGSLLTSGGKKYFRYNGLNQQVQKRLGKKITESGLEGLSIPWRMASGAVKSSFPLAAYEGSMGYVHALVNNQDPDKEYMDPWGAMGHGVIRGGILGFITGGVSSGILGRRATIASKADGGVSKETLANLPWYDRAAWKAASTPGLIATESGIFTGATTVEKIYNGEDVRPSDILKDFLTNSALFATIKAQNKVFDKAFESAATISNAMKRKSKETSVDKALEAYRDKFEAGEHTEKFKEVIRNLEKEGFADREAIELIQKKAEAIMGDIVYIRNSLSKGEKNFINDKEAIYRINNLKDFIKELEGDLRKVSFGDTVKEKTLRKELESQIEGLKELSGVYELKVTDPLAKKFQEYLNKDKIKEAKDRDSILSEISDRHKEMYPQSKKDATVIYKGKKVSVMDPSLPLKVLKDKAKSLKALKQEKYGKSAVDKEIDSILDIKSDKEFRDPKTETGESILKPGTVRYADRPKFAEIVESIKNPFKKSLAKAREAFDKSSKWIKSLVQNKYATDTAFRSNEPFTPKETSTRVSALKKFAEFLANRKKDFTTMTDKDFYAYAEKAPEAHKVAVSDLIKYMKSIEAGAPGTMHPSMIKIDPGKVYEKFQSKEVEVKDKAERIGLRDKHVDLSKKDGEITRVQSKGGESSTKVTPITNQLKGALKRIAKTFKKQMSIEKLKTGLSSPLFRSKKSKESNGDKSEGRPLDVKDLNNFIAKLIGSWKKDGSGRKSAVAVRSVLLTWAKTKKKKYFGEDVNIVEIVDIVGLGHGNKADLQQIYTKYGKNKSKMIYREIIKDFYKDLKKYKKIEKEGGNIVEEEVYNIVEIGKALEKVLSMKPNDVIKVEVRDPLTKKEREAGKKEGKLIREIEIDKNTAEGLMRMLIENPSRLNEIVVEKVDKVEQQKIEKDKIYDKLNESKNQAEIDAKNQDANKETEGMSEFEKIKFQTERAKQKEEAEARKKEWRASEEYKERERINREIKSKNGPEKELAELAPGDVRIPKSKGAKKDKYLNRVIRDIRLKIFGHTDYKYTSRENGPNKTDLELYKGALEQAIKDIKNPKGIEKELENKGISELQKVEIAQLLGRKDGNLNALTPGSKRLLRQITKDIDVLENNFTKPQDQEYQDSKGIWGLKNKIKANRGIFMRTYLLIQKAAEKTKGSAKKYLETIENLTSRIDVYTETYRGMTNLEYNAMTNVLKHGKKKEAIKDITWMDGRQMSAIIKQLKNPKLSKAEREAYTELYNKLKPHYDASLKTGTAENIALKIWEGSRDRIWKEFEHSILDANKGIGPAKLKKIKKVLKDMFEKDYMPSFVRKEAKHIFEGKEYLERSNVYEEILKKKAMEKVDGGLGKKLKIPRSVSLRQKLLNPKYRAKYNEVLKNLKESDSNNAINIRREARNEASNEIVNGIENAINHASSNNFMKRGEQLPMFITINKNGRSKVIRTYESNMYNVINAYYISSSRFLSVAKNAPEFLGSNFYKAKGGDLKTALERLDALLGSKEKGLSSYMNDTVSELIGTKESNSYKLISDIANFSAVSGLSAFATPGIKNLTLGQTQIFTTFSGMEYFKEIAKLTFKRNYFKESMNRATKVGAAQYTQRELGFGKDIMKNAGDKIYKFSLMTQAENVNRMMAINVGENFAHRQFEVLSSKTSTQNQKFEAERFLRETLRFTQKEVNFIKQNKHNDLSRPENIKEFNYLMDKVQVYSHKATQGGVGTMDVPKWMSQGNKKDFLLFQRIATSVTGNIVTSVVKPALRGNFMPLIKYGIVNYLGGASSYAIYKFLYDDESPKNLGSEFDKALMYLWRNETFGTFGLVLDNMPVNLNPYYNGVSSGDIVRNLTPVIARNSMDFFKATVSAVGGYKTAGQATHDFLKSSVSLYGQIDKAVTRQGMGDKSEHFKQGKSAINYKRQYRQFLGETTANFLNVEGSRNQPYYRDLRAAIHWGTDEDIAKHYHLAVNHAYDNFLRTPGINKIGAFNKAHDAVMQSILQMNPTFSTKTRDMSATQRKKYLEWLRSRDKQIRKTGGKSNAYKTVIEVEKRFKRTINKIKSIRGNQKLINKYSNDPELNYNNTSGRNKNRLPMYRDYKYLDDMKRDPSYYDLRMIELYGE